jgi:alkyl hydroperoxide reductase subunit AhpF
VSLEGDEIISARAVVIATGARYRKLSFEGVERFEGTGVHYSATPIDVRPCLGRPVVIVGGGNSAGQAAMYLSAQASHVHMLIRGPRLSSTMSDYLVQRIQASRTIKLHTCSEVVQVEGENHLSHVTWRSTGTRGDTRFATEHLFVMIGADPCTTWLRDCVQLNSMVSCEHRQDLKKGVRSRPRCEGSLLWAMCALGRSRGWRPLLERALLWSQRFIAIWVISEPRASRACRCVFGEISVPSFRVTQKGREVYEYLRTGPGHG